MRWLSRLQQRLEPYAIPRLALWLIIGQGMLYGVSVSDPNFVLQLSLIPDNVVAGEYWRLVTFLFIPPVTNPVFLFFALYFFHLTGSALEHYWGALRFNVFLLIGYVATVAAAFLIPELRSFPHSNAFIGSSVFLAFAKLYPNYMITLFFFLPIRVYWVAMLTWIMLLLHAIEAPNWGQRLYVLAGVANYLIFFRREVLRGAVSNERLMRRQITRITRTHEHPVAHRCVVCGLTDGDDPNMDFRYCSRCHGTPCYCSRHLPDHQHREPPATA